MGGAAAGSNCFQIDNVEIVKCRAINASGRERFGKWEMKSAGGEDQLRMHPNYRNPMAAPGPRSRSG